MGDYTTTTNNNVSTTTAPVKTSAGLLTGLQRPNGTRAFLGIPYATPPVGDLRWRPPQPLQPWSGVRKADKFGSSSLQFPPPTTSIYSGGESDFSEDCLYLNVYTGAGSDGDSNGRPVLVWFHFGAFLFGSASNPLYDGSNLAAKGVTVVTVNYRLGRFGFLAHPELTAESGDKHASGNYGIMDQIASLQWVQQNIATFGGDPTNVTVGGASAGGASIHILRCSPLAKSLFTKAICESGAGVAPAVDHATNGNNHGHVASYSTLDAAEQTGTELTDLLGVSSISELRQLPAHKILTTFLPRAKGPWKPDIWPGTASLSMFDAANPIIDGYILPESPLTAMLSGKAIDMPMLAGNVGNEASGLPYLTNTVDYETYINKTFGKHAPQAMKLYPALTDADVRGSSSLILADQVFTYPTWTSARIAAAAVKKAPSSSSSAVWYYTILRAPPIPQTSDIIERNTAGAFHVAGIPYGFGTFNTWNWDWTDLDKNLSEQISDSWVRFMTNGDPNHGSSPGSDSGSESVWPAVTSSDGPVQIWDGESRVEPQGVRIKEMSAFWDKFYEIEGKIK